MLRVVLRCSMFKLSCRCVRFYEVFPATESSETFLRLQLKPCSLLEAFPKCRGEMWYRQSVNECAVGHQLCPFLPFRCDLRRMKWMTIDCIEDDCVPECSLHFLRLNLCVDGVWAGPRLLIDGQCAYMCNSRTVTPKLHYRNMLAACCQYVVQQCSCSGVWD